MKRHTFLLSFHLQVRGFLEHGEIWIAASNVSPASAWVFGRVYHDPNKYQCFTRKCAGFWMDDVLADVVQAFHPQVRGFLGGGFGA